MMFRASRAPCRGPVRAAIVPPSTQRLERAEDPVKRTQTDTAPGSTVTFDTMNGFRPRKPGTEGENP